MTAWEPTVDACDEYMVSRTGRYEYRAVRYRMAADWLVANGLSDDHTLVDVGAGWTEFDYCLRAEYGWRGRYIPLDGGIDGTDLEQWTAKRDYDWFVALELLEHLRAPTRLVHELQKASRIGGVVSVPDPAQVDVLGMDETHLTEVDSAMLHNWGFTAKPVQLYGGAFGGNGTDALLGAWLR